MLLYTVGSSALSFFSGQNTAQAQEEAARAKQKYYNALAVAEEKRGFQEIGQYGRTEAQMTQSGKEILGEQSTMAASAGYAGESLTDVAQNTTNNLSIDKAILQQAAIQALDTSREKSKQLRLAGQAEYEVGQMAQKATWLDTASTIAGKWIPKGGQ